MGTGSGKKRKRILVRILLSFFCLFCLIVLVSGVMLKRGIHLDQFTIGGVSISNFSLIWSDRLKVHIGTITIAKGRKTNPPPGGTSFVGKTVKAAQIYTWLFSESSIDNLVIGEQILTIKLSQGEDQTSMLDMVTKDVRFRSRLVFDEADLVIDIVEAESSQYNSELTGQMRFEVENDRVSGALSAIIKGSFPLALEFVADSEQISFEGREAAKITDIKPLVDLFGLSDNIQRWITGYLSGSRYHLKMLKGTLPWNNPKEIFETFEAEVRVDDTEYVFAPGLEPVKDSSTDVFFQKGVLIIKPNEATFYGQDCGESWVDIDFNDPANNLLTAHIKTHAVLNDDILKVLDYYNISLPFKQVEGNTATDFRLAIILNKQEISTEGVFEIDEGTIGYGGENYKISGARIKLAHGDIIVEDVNIGYKNNVKVQVQGTLQPKEKTGDLDITLEQLSLKLSKSQLNLDISTNSPQVHYHFSPEQQIIDVQASSWELDSLKMNLGAFRAPIFLEDLSIKLPPVLLGLSSGILSKISGDVSIKNKRAHLTCDLLKYQSKDLELKSPVHAIDIVYDQNLVIRTEEKALVSLNKIPVVLYPSELKYEDDVLTVTKSRISYGGFFDGHVTGYYNIKNSDGRFSLGEINITNEKLVEYLEIDDETVCEISDVDGNFRVYFPEYDLKIGSDEKKKWSVSFGNLSTIYDRSKLLQKYDIKEGSLVVSSVDGKRPYDFSIDISDPYQLLIEGDTSVNQLQVTGRLSDEGIFATVNKNLEIEYIEKNLKLKSNNLGYNISAVIKLLQEHSKKQSQSSSITVKESSDEKSFSLRLNAENSQIYLSPQSRIMADAINLEFGDGKLSMNLLHGSGHIKMDLEDGNFVLEGRDLNDEFMGTLIQSSYFKGGRMSMDSKGSFDDFSIIFNIEDTVLNQLATLNNVMAVLNTVPALITFSLPGYDTKGLPVDSATVGIAFKDKMATFESIVVKSSKFDGMGKGWIDFTKKQIDMDFHLKTQAGKNMSKVPLVGYALAGEDGDPSLSLKIEGSVDDPKVSNSLVKDIITYPVEVLYRILALPFRKGEKKEKLPEEKDAPSGTAGQRTKTDKIE